jgi:hypothetical protein
MTGSAAGRRVPGTTLLKIARRLLSEQLVSTLVEPTIADLQCDVADAGASRRKRLHARWRGYRAFWTVMLVAPFASSGASSRTAGAAAFPNAVVCLVTGAALLVLVAVINPPLGASVAVVAAVGTLFAFAIHAWYQRHPSDLPAPAERRWRTPQINFSSTEVAGNSGGLIFVLGSVFIVAVGLPSVFWFLLAGTVAGCLLAQGLVAWHTRHPHRSLEENRIVWR